MVGKSASFWSTGSSPVPDTNLIPIGTSLTVGRKLTDKQRVESRPQGSAFQTIVEDAILR